MRAWSYFDLYGLCKALQKTSSLSDKKSDRSSVCVFFFFLLLIDPVWFGLLIDPVWFRLVEVTVVASTLFTSSSGFFGKHPLMSPRKQEGVKICEIHNTSDLRGRKKQNRTNVSLSKSNKSMSSCSANGATLSSWTFLL